MGCQIAGPRLINAFDANTLHFLNQFARRSWLFDECVSFAASTQLCGAMVIAALWWLWFRNGESQARNRGVILSGLAGSLVSQFVARGLALFIPFRERPFSIPTLYNHLPFGDDIHGLINWSSFPSDHAAFYFAISTCIFFVSRKLGIAAFCFSFFVDCLLRVYMAFHYPTDVLAGAIIGVGIASLFLNPKVCKFIARKPLDLLESSPGVFYAFFFFTCYLFATEFDPVRVTLDQIWHGLHHAVRGRL